MALTVKEEEFSNTLIKNASAFDRLKLGNLKNLKIQRSFSFYIYIVCPYYVCFSFFDAVLSHRSVSV
ncbi:hypothetical protein PFDG_05500 [Plasmodium falciparum Dd2]|uniref:Uncharacterized protein n=1 Tax=Plasmodium falciparum (isolate Dd2) TaxID=57267 RepID=A0A0L7M486_PLAF4|nr:hypothetical protein PFDG_05500 [Plasmodium falciparum Dd2]